MRAAWIVTCVLAAWCTMGIAWSATGEEEGQSRGGGTPARPQGEGEEKVLPRRHEKVVLGMLEEKLLSMMPKLTIASASPMGEAIQYDVYRYADEKTKWEWSVGCYKKKVIWFSLTQELERDSKEPAQDLFKADFMEMWTGGEWAFDKRGNGYARDEETIVSFFIVRMKRQARKFQVMVTDLEQDREKREAARSYREAQRREEEG